MNRKQHLDFLATGVYSDLKAAFEAAWIEYGKQTIDILQPDEIIRQYYGPLSEEELSLVKLWSHERQRIRTELQKERSISPYHTPPDMPESVKKWIRVRVPQFIGVPLTVTFDEGNNPRSRSQLSVSNWQFTTRFGCLDLSPSEFHPRLGPNRICIGVIDFKVGKAITMHLRKSVLGTSPTVVRVYEEHAVQRYSKGVWEWERSWGQGFLGQIELDESKPTETISPPG